MKRLVAEWERQTCIAFILPHEQTDWNAYLDEILDSYYSLISLISKYQKVLIITQNKTLAKSLTKLPNVQIITASYNDTWARDTLPISVENNGKIEMLNFTFNAWGGKYDGSLDNALSQTLFPKAKKIDYILEGGAIDSNGAGLLLLHKDSFTHNRNAEDFETIQKQLKAIFASSLLIVQNGYHLGDDTDSHIDTLARFVNKKTIFYSQSSNKKNETHASLQAMECELKELAKNHNLELIAIPNPAQQYYQNRPIISTYLNFIIINDAVIVPIFDDVNDEQTLRIFRQYFPLHDVIGFSSNVFSRQNGSLHCACMNFYNTVII